MKFNLLINALTSLTLLFSMTSYSAPNDVKPEKIKKGDTFVKITKTDEYSLRFEKCLWEIPGACSQIGSQHDYLISDLNDRVAVEGIEMLNALYVTIAIAAGATFVAGGVASAVALTGWSGTILGIADGSIVVTKMLGIFAGINLVENIEAINPLEQTHQLYTLRSNVLSDKDFTVKNVPLFIKRLEIVLAKI